MGWFPLYLVLSSYSVYCNANGNQEKAALVSARRAPCNSHIIYFKIKFQKEVKKEN